MTGRNRTDERRGDYVDSTTAEQIQHARLEETKPIHIPDRPPAAAQLGGLRRLFRRIVRLLSGHAVGATLAFAALVVAGCSPAGETDPPSAQASPGTRSNPTELQAAASSCDDQLNDAVTFDGGIPTTQPADANRAFRLEQIRLTSEGEDFTMWLSPRGEYEDSPPPNDNLLQLHLRSLDDPARTGSVQIGFRPDQGPDAWNVRTGPRAGPMVDIEIVDDRIWHGRAGGGEAQVTISADQLPVSPPFHWYVTSQRSDEPNAGDVCPNVTGFTDDSVLPVFPQQADATGNEPATVDITGTDYRFDGIPETVAAGTRLTFTNGSEREPHEMVILRLNDDAPPVKDFVSLPRKQGEAHVERFVGVIMAAQPGETGAITKGDALLDEPGRYVLLCALPLGSDPAAIAANPYGPPEGAPPPDSPPHIAEGMFTEVTVTP